MTVAVVLLSGGLDSTTTLAYALSKGYDVVALTVSYGQRHSRELESAKAVAKHYGLKRHIVMDLDLSFLRTSALTCPDVEVPLRDSAEGIGDDIPVTYVPARNIIMLSLAAGLCETEGGEVIFIGANAIDYSGYPDCRPEFFEAFEKVLRVGTKSGVEGRPIEIKAPILRKSKAEIVKLAKELDAPLHLTWSCYKGGKRACGHCDSCLLRLKGFEEAGYSDPVEYEAGP
ncbi:7-cyano-7-deazaguanine synthase QueC [Methanomassiliicoccus luminyensis]|uniref:7-cyano-7-deazaguanine synthase QueC n=1 Tax=Methanomassiliicoccus luminyensis TaxID=1080712 RepID=UPI000369E811|nr:7-cyano-7-deazaguanine synthase QueC [Methanomassiliicoccus luminyensis]